MNIHSYRDLLIKQVMSYSNVAAIDNPNDVYQMLKRVNTSIKQRTCFRKFLDVITFQFIKVIILKKKIPALIKKIKQVAGDKLTPYSDYTAKNKNWKDTIAFKIDLLERAQAHFIGVNEKNQILEATAKEVNAFFEDRLRRLNAKENVAIPIYYHASRAGADEIAKTATLKKSARGAQGAGVYFSTCDESYTGYGAYTFAMDPALLEKYSATYQQGAFQVGEERSLWLCAKDDIKLDLKRVAYIVVPDENGVIEKTKKYWEDGNFFALPITRPAATEIRKCIKAVHVHAVPSHWSKYRSSDRSTGLKHIVAN